MSSWRHWNVGNHSFLWTIYLAKKYERPATKRNKIRKAFLIEQHNWMEQNNNNMTDAQGPTNTIKLHKNDCPTEWVTAFTDRAEVTRLIKTKVTAGT